jgi:hypothetical protein
MQTRTFLSVALIAASFGLRAFDTAMADTRAMSAKLSGASDVPASTSVGLTTSI